MSTVREIMSPHVFSVDPGDPAAEALEYLQTLRIHTAAVVDEDSGRPVGMLSYADLIGDLRGVKVRDRMNTPAVFVLASALIKDAARVIALSGFHHLVVVDAEQRAVGFLSVIDIIGAQLGWYRDDAPPPQEAPASLGLTWTDEERLTQTGLLAAPAEPGIVLLQRRAPEAPHRLTVVWAETAPNIRGRLLDLWQEPPSRLSRYLDRGELVFRAAPASVAATRGQVLAQVVRHASAP